MKILKRRIKQDLELLNRRLPSERTGWGLEQRKRRKELEEDLEMNQPLDYRVYIAQLGSKTSKRTDDYR